LLRIQIAHNIVGFRCNPVYRFVFRAV
jgi:hypothetical protein